MKRKNNISTIFFIVSILMSACTDDRLSENGELPRMDDSNGIIRLTVAPESRTLSLSIDASVQARANVWIDLDGDGLRSKDGVEDIKVFNRYQDYSFAAGLNTVTLHGDITYFAAADNKLTAIDVSGSQSLLTLNIPMNRLTTLDVSKNRVLERLDCSGNELSTLNVSGNSALLSLWCANNSLKGLDVSGNAKLFMLDCSGNRLETLDTSKNSQLMRLLCQNNSLKSLDISDKSGLNLLWSFGNPLEKEKISRIIAMLKDVEGGDLWLSLDPLSDKDAQVAINKGWKVL